ncbi:uncharacterized protein HKW66_Vig0232850 [Vigna angularis]|uniref:Uncharacterized protein n=1 Tax=Phaseolus angularis TaxID=3914 RepID=A0A8T0KS89_PHAAN|nr:uncharacterized protein HKW66_Vig0232850 [Vigna angularis]
MRAKGVRTSPRRYQEYQQRQRKQSSHLDESVVQTCQRLLCERGERTEHPESSSLGAEKAGNDAVKKSIRPDNTIITTSIALLGQELSVLANVVVSELCALFEVGNVDAGHLKLPFLLPKHCLSYRDAVMEVCVGSVRKGKAFAPRMKWRLREKMDSQLGYLNWDSWFLCLGFCVELAAVDGSLRLRVRNVVVHDLSSSAGFWRSKLVGDCGYGAFATALQRL